MDKIKELLADFYPDPTGNEFLDQRYDPNSKYYRFFYLLTRELKPKTVVELGSWQGTSAAHFAGGCPDTKVITVDHHTDPGDRTNKAMAVTATMNFNNLKYCQGWTCNEIFEEEFDKHSIAGKNAFPKVLKELNGETIDILFIDSWHVYPQAVRDWEAYKPYLSENALVIVDDVIEGTKGSAIHDVRKFWDELKGDKWLDDTLHAGYPMGFMRI